MPEKIVQQALAMAWLEGYQAHEEEQGGSYYTQNPYNPYNEYGTGDEEEAYWAWQDEAADAVKNAKLLG